MSNQLSHERYDELFFDAVKNGTPLGDGDFQKGDVVVRDYRKNGNEIFGLMFIKGHYVMVEDPISEPPGV